jgi:hypothetical protein
MDSHPKESRVILALEALKHDKNLSIRAAAKVYNVPATTIRHRCDGRTARCNIRPNLTNLIESEEQAIVRYVLELATRAFPPRLRGVEEMANELLYIRSADLNSSIKSSISSKSSKLTAQFISSK